MEKNIEQKEVSKYIGLVDCNNFFVSCERVFNPNLNGKPVVVLSCNDGCVVSRSNEAKALHIPMGAPIFKYKNEVARYGIAVRSSNFALYADMSRRVMSIVKSNVKKLEVYSVDEGFFYVHESDEVEMMARMRRMREMILAYVGMPVSIGMARTKTLAKICTKLAKTNPEMAGCLLMREEDEQKYLEKFPVEDVWGIGGRTTRYLKDNNVYTAWEFLKLPDTALRSHLGIGGIFRAQELRGVAIHGMTVEAKKKKSMLSSRSFGENVRKFEVVEDALRFHIEKIARDLQQQNSVCGTLTVFVYIKDAHGYNGRSAVERRVVLEGMTSDVFVLIRAGISGLRDLYSDKYIYKKVGAYVGEISSAYHTQTSLFTDVTQAKKSEKFSRVAVEMKHLYGGNIGVGAVEKYRTWGARTDNISAKCTTEWSELIEAEVC